jgi:hypothetical protein
MRKKFKMVVFLSFFFKLDFLKTKYAIYHFKPKSGLMQKKLKD